MVILTSLAVLTIALLLRVVVSRRSRSALSVDYWFWKAYVEGCWSQRRFPPVLPQYLLDEAQWYPPLFPWLLVHIPRSAFDRTERYLGIVLDLVRLGVLLAVCAYLCGDDWRVVAAAGLVYATTPVLVIYNVQLNPRALAALWIDGAFLLLTWTVVTSGPWVSWLGVVALSALVLLTHKMTTQLLWFAALATAALIRDWRLALLVPLSVVMAWVLSGGFYAKVLRAHADIVTFWNRNWRWHSAAPIRESTAYGEAGYQSPARLHQAGLAGSVRHLIGFARLLPAGWVAWPMFGPAALSGQWSTEAIAVSLWMTVGLTLSLATTFAPPLRCLGPGSLYLFNVASPVALLCGLALRDGSSLAAAALGAGLLANVAAIGLFYWRLPASARDVDPGWEALLAHLSAAPRGPVLCAPQTLYDEVAYRTGQPVLYGGHGYGFRRLEPIYPRLQLSFPEIRQRYGLRYVIVRDGMMNDRALADLPASPTTFGSYRLFDYGAPLATPRPRGPEEPIVR